MTSRSPKAERGRRRRRPGQTHRFIKLTGAAKSIKLEAKARGLVGLKGYTSDLTRQTPEFVIDAYHQLWRIEKSFACPSTTYRPGPVYHHKRESIEAHLTIVLAALDRAPNELGHQEIRENRTARPHRANQNPPPDPDRTDPLPDRPP